MFCSPFFGWKCLLKQVLVNFNSSLILHSQELSEKLLVTVNWHQTSINCAHMSFNIDFFLVRIRIIRGFYRIYQNKDLNKYLPRNSFTLCTRTSQNLGDWKPFKGQGFFAKGHLFLYFTVMLIFSSQGSGSGSDFVI